jgi:hypothetical protein
VHFKILDRLSEIEPFAIESAPRNRIDEADPTNPFGETRASHAA